MSRRRPIWLCAVGAFLAAASARAGEVDRFLPDDTEMVVSVNVRQIIDSDLFRKHLEEPAREALKSNEDVGDVLKDLGLDPFRDVDRVIAARPSGADQDRGLVILHGRFDLDKFRAKAEQAAKDEPDVLRIHKAPDGAGGKFMVYEVEPGGQAPTLFVALPNASTVLVSPGKDYVVDAMRKEAAKDKPQLKDKNMQALLERMNDRQGVSVAVVGKALADGAPEELKDIVAKVDAVGGGVSIGDEIKVEVVVSAKDPDDAKDVGEAFHTHLKEARLLVAALAFAQSNQTDAVLDALNAVKISVKDKTVLVKASISADVIEDALKKDK